MMSLLIQLFMTFWNLVYFGGEHKVNQVEIRLMGLPEF